jgi:hypothetical protein
VAVSRSWWPCFGFGFVMCLNVADVDITFVQYERKWKYVPMVRLFTLHSHTMIVER